MAIIAQKKLFGWENIEELGDLERLYMVLKYLADEKLKRVLEEERDKGRDDYPLRAVWNSILAGVVYEHQSVQSLRRELERNGQLRDLCGFDAEKGIKAVPGSWVYSRLDVSFGFDALHSRVEEDEASVFSCTVYYACHGVGEDQGKAEGLYAQPCQGCLRYHFATHNFIHLKTVGEMYVLDVRIRSLWDFISRKICGKQVEGVFKEIIQQAS